MLEDPFIDFIFFPASDFVGIQPNGFVSSLPESPDYMASGFGSAFGFTKNNYSGHDFDSIITDFSDDFFQRFSVLSPLESAPQFDDLPQIGQGFEQSHGINYVQL